MTLTEFLAIAGSAFGGTATAFLLVGFFGKSIVGHWFNKALESYKHENAKSLEQIKSDLQKIANRQNAKFDFAFTEYTKFMQKVSSGLLQIQLDYLNFALAQDFNLSKAAEFKNKCDELGNYAYTNQASIPPKVFAEICGIINSYTINISISTAKHQKGESWKDLLLQDFYPLSQKITTLVEEYRQMLEDGTLTTETQNGLDKTDIGMLTMPIHLQHLGAKK